MYPAESYNSQVPSPADFLGYELGTDLTEHHRMERYIHKLQETAPDRVKVEKIGESQEGRPMYLVIMDEPTRGRSYGAIWYTLEQRYGVPFTALRVEDFNRIDLNEYDVVVMPPGSIAGYKRVLGKGGIEKLRAWIQNGGTFVGIKEGAVFAADEEVNLSSSRLLGSSGNEEVRVAQTPGSIPRANLDINHFLSLGYENKVPVHINSSHIFTPSEKGANVAIFDNELVVSGFVFEDNKPNFPGNAYLVHEPVGRGDVVLFAEQPVFRLYWRGLERLFINSLLLTPSF